MRRHAIYAVDLSPEGRLMRSKFVLSDRLEDWDDLFVCLLEEPRRVDPQYEVLYDAVSTLRNILIQIANLKAALASFSS